MARFAVVISKSPFAAVEVKQVGVFDRKAEPPSKPLHVTVPIVTPINAGIVNFM